MQLDYWKLSWQTQRWWEQAQLCICNSHIVHPFKWLPLQLPASSTPHISPTQPVSPRQCSHNTAMLWHYKGSVLNNRHIRHNLVIRSLICYALPWKLFCYNAKIGIPCSEYWKSETFQFSEWRLNSSTAILLLPASLASFLSRSGNPLQVTSFFLRLWNKHRHLLVYFSTDS